MTERQVFIFLTKFRNAHDVRVLMKHKKITIFNILSIAYRLWRGVPIAKITNHKWFYGLEFYTNKHTLDPRPDSETLVEAVLKNEPGARHIIDLGTGTGCLIISLLKNLPNATGTAIDISRPALRVAARNRKRHNLESRLTLKRTSFASFSTHFKLSSLRGAPATKQSNKKFLRKGFDWIASLFAYGSRPRNDDKQNTVIISNPPYIPVGDESVNTGAHFDPKLALYGGEDGLKYYREIANCKLYIVHCKLYIEIGCGQETAITKIFTNAGWRPIAKFPDLAGITRVLSFEK